MAFKVGGDPGMVGARRIAFSATSNRTFVAGGFTTTVQAYTGNPGTAFVLAGESASLGARIGALVAANSKLYALTEIAVTVLTDAAVPTVLATYVNDAAQTANWLAVTASLIIAPLRHGIVVLNASNGAEIDRMESRPVQPTYAVYSAALGRLFAFDAKTAMAVTFAISSAGAISGKGATFAVPNGKDIRGAVIDGTTLLVITDHRLIKFSLADIDNPAFVSSTTYVETLYGITVLASGKYFLATDPPLAIEAYPCPWSAADSAAGGAALRVLHGHDSFVLGANPVTASDGSSVVMGCLQKSGAIKTTIPTTGVTMPPTTAAWDLVPYNGLIYSRAAKFNPAAGTYATVAAGGSTDSVLMRGKWCAGISRIFWEDGSGWGFYDPVGDAWSNVHTWAVMSIGIMGGDYSETDGYVYGYEVGTVYSARCLPDGTSYLRGPLINTYPSFVRASGGYVYYGYGTTLLRYVNGLTSPTTLTLTSAMSVGGDWSGGVARSLPVVIGTVLYISLGNGNIEKIDLTTFTSLGVLSGQGIDAPHLSLCPYDNCIYRSGGTAGSVELFDPVSGLISTCSPVGLSGGVSAICDPVTGNLFVVHHGDTSAYVVT